MVLSHNGSPICNAFAGAQMHQKALTGMLIHWANAVRAFEHGPCYMAVDCPLEIGEGDPAWGMVHAGSANGNAWV
jgi:hypothetical protein